MSIFRKGRETPSAPQPSTSTPSPPPSPRPQAPARREPPTPMAGKTHIARGTKVVGEITGDAELLIDGVVEGEIHLDSLVIVGSEGRVQGTIRAVAVRVGGKVVGNIHGKERVEVLASGRLEGDIAAPSVPIAEGAFFQGKVDMSSPAKKKESVGKKPQKEAATAAPKASSTKPQADNPSATQASSKSNPPGQAGGKR